jgi:hypothetical protein
MRLICNVAISWRTRRSSVSNSYRWCLTEVFYPKYQRYCDKNQSDGYVLTVLILLM